VAFRFQRRKKVAPGVNLNVSKGGAGVSVGRRGAQLSASRRGLTGTFSLIGTGLSWIWRKSK
jgi:hypothetical protein